MDQNNNIDPDQMRQFNEELSNLTGSSQDLDKAFAQLSKSISTMAGSAATSSKSMATAAPAIASVSGGVSRAMDDLNKLNQKYAASGDKLDKFTDSLTKGISNISQTMGKFALDLGKGNTSFSMLNGVIDSVAGALSDMTKNIPVFGGLISGSIQAAAAGAKFLVDMLEKNLKVFQDLSRSGALVADGMSGVNRQFYASGMTMEGFTKAIKTNADALSSFKGTVGAGAEMFAGAVGKLTKQSDSALRKLGMTADEIGETAGFFLEREIRLGRARNMTEEQLAKGTEKYAKELDALQKITGESKESLAKRQQKMETDARFGLLIQEEERKGNVKGAEALKNFISTVSDPEMVKALMDTSTGYLGVSEEAQKMVRTLGPGFADIMDDILRKNITEDEGRKRFTRILDDAAVKFKETSGLLGSNSAFYDSNRMMIASNKMSGKSMAAAIDTRNKQIKSDEELTKKTVEAQLSMEKMSQEIYRLGGTLLPDAADAVATFTTKLKEAVEYISDRILSKPATVEKGAGGSVSKREGAGATIIGGAGGEGDAGAIMDAAGSATDPLAGLRVKKGDVHRPGAEIDPRLISLANKIQENLPNFVHFSGFNDAYHEGTDSDHAKGLALDFVLNKKPSKEEGAAIIAKLKSLGADVVLDEYNNPSARATAGHIHAAIKKARFGGVFDGPSSGYPVMLHGRETVIPEGLSFAGKENILQQVQKSSLPSDMSNNVTNTRSDMSVDMIAELYNLMSEKLDDMVSKLTTSNQIQDQLLRYSRT